MSCDCNKNIKAGVIGTLGANMVRGFSAYEIAVKNGYKGTEAEWLASLKGEELASRVSSLTDTKFATRNVIEVPGVAAYYDDLTEFAGYGITEPGWYVFARIKAPGGSKVTSAATVEGAAGYIATAGEDHIDVAVKFKVAAMSQLVKIKWGDAEETFVFKDTDLAIRNLDYRVTFYVYDSSKYATWHYKLATGSFADGNSYYVKRDGAYTPAEVTAGEAIPAGYYVQSPAYELTTDTNFVEGTVYYIKQGDDYVRANVTAGDPVAADTYYVQTTVYVRTEDETFAEGTTYYTLEENVYTPAEVTAGEAIPNYYVHDKLTFEGMVRNVTYNFNEVVDCPVEFILPEVTDEEHGFWFEVRCLFAGQYSMTLVPPSPDIKIATEHTQQEQKGINMINLLYTAVAGTKVWRFMNTRSTVPA